MTRMTPAKCHREAASQLARADVLPISALFLEIRAQLGQLDQGSDLSRWTHRGGGCRRVSVGDAR